MKLKVWITREHRPRYRHSEKTLIHVHKPEMYSRLNAHLDGGSSKDIFWSGEYPHRPLPLPIGKRMGVKSGECKKAILIIDEKIT